MDQLGDSISVPERRSKPRIACDYPAILKGYRNGKKFEESARVINMSSGGIYVILQYPVEKDLEVTIRIALPTRNFNSADSSRLAATGTVVRAEQYSVDKFGVAIMFQHYRFL
jgi:hypothetical protein